jgi:hypothetical protein
MNLGEIQVQIITAAGTDELVNVDFAAFETAIYRADRLVPQDRRAAVAGLTGGRECHGVL